MKYLLPVLVIAIGLYSCAPKGYSFTQQERQSTSHVTVEPPQMMASSENINSLEELVAPFKGKLVYLDIWATWCGPCRMEFGYSKELHHFVANKDIELLYVSIDKNTPRQKWTRMVKNFELGGHHLMANSQLRQNLIDQFYSGEKGGRKMISLPTFVIVDRNGQVVEADANRPSDERQLYDQLSGHL